MATVTRHRTDRMVGGVAGGLSKTYDVDVNLLRAVFAVPIFWGIYVALWAFLPDEDEDGGRD